jgi:hypothetical protein
MTEQQISDFEETAGIVLAHSALMTSVLGVLKSRGLIDQATVNEMIDLALVGLEAASELRPATFGRARQVLEELSRTMGGPLKR